MTLLQNFDMDGTIIDSGAAIKACQIDGLVKATGKDYSSIEKELATNNLNAVLKNYNINKDVFFKEYYNTFDPFEAVKNGQVKVFDDANIIKQNSLYLIKSLISNSSSEATNSKLEACNIKDAFNYVFAEYSNSKAKPTPYMAKQLVEKLKEDNTLNGIATVHNIGDQLVDMEFGEVLNEEISSALRLKPEFKNYLIDREGKYDYNKNIILINSLSEIYR